jgi:hypothetical protein
MDDCPKFKSLNDICNNPYEKKTIKQQTCAESIKPCPTFQMYGDS